MIYYVGYYNCDLIRSENRIVSPAAESKMNYIISSLVSATDEVIEVISPAETRLFKIVKGKRMNIGENVLLKTFSSFSSSNKFIRGIGHIFTHSLVLLYLLTNIEKKDHIIVYHSLLLMNTVRLINKIKGCKLTIEVEELYSDVIPDEKKRIKEINYLQIADNYIYVTETLRNEINTKKPHIISHGIYGATKRFGSSFKDGKIHVVYAGTFNQVKGGVNMAIASAEYLDENYVLEILGTGSESDINKVKKLIFDVSKKTNCRINYVGLKVSDDFLSYLQACHIGLSTQQSGGKFNESSFPSKILMYMSNGLEVVSVRISVVESSKVGKYIHYYDQEHPKEVAKAISSIDVKKCCDNGVVLEQLHFDFVKQLRKLL